MPKEKLTKRVVDRLESRDKDYILFDEDLPGLGVRVMPSDKRFYLIQYRRHGRTRRVMIGQHGPITAEIARREANRMLGAVRGGGELFINPFFGKQRVRTVASADAAELHGKYAHTPYQSNRVLGVLSKMMNLAKSGACAIDAQTLAMTSAPLPRAQA